jgi:hypothetical protein
VFRLSRRKVTDRDGVVWLLYIDRAWATPEKSVLQLRSDAGLRLYRPGCLTLRRLVALNPIDVWHLEHQQAWLLVAEPVGDEATRRMWITPARTPRGAKQDLDELGRHILSGRSPATFGTSGDDNMEQEST